MPAERVDRSADERGATETILRLLAARRTRAEALIVSLSGEDVVVEDSSSGAWLGQKLHLPVRLDPERGTVADVSAARLSLGWTQLCGWRPAHIATEPLRGQGLYLIVVGAGDPPASGELAPVAAALAQLLRAAALTTRERGASSRIAALIDNLPLPIAFVDSRTIEVILNEPARKLLDIRGEQPSEAVVAEAFARLVANAGGDFGAHVAARPNDSLAFDVERAGRFFEVESRWIEDDRLSGRLWMFRDVTSEREVTRFKDELVSTVSHELRTPLTSINGSLGLLKGGAAGDLPEPAIRLIDVAHRNGDRLALLVNDLLDLDKLHADRLDLHRTTVDMAALLRDAVEQNEPYARRYGAALVLELPQWPISAQVDPARTAQVIGNLISNAAKYSPPGGTITVRLSTYDHRLRISVSDQGPGISPEFRKHLFKRFSQDGSGAHKVGTGLGLAICKGIVERHGGTIALDTGVGVGTTFHVDLPVGGT